jgi:hypothetical protein
LLDRLAKEKEEREQQQQNSNNNNNNNTSDADDNTKNTDVATTATTVTQPIVDVKPTPTTTTSTTAAATTINIEQNNNNDDNNNNNDDNNNNNNDDDDDDDDAGDMFASDDDMFASDNEKATTTTTTMPAAAGAVPNRGEDDWDDPDGYYRHHVGETIMNRFTVLGLYGKGVFSTVLKVADTQANDRLVALKLVRNNEVMAKAADTEVIPTYSYPCIFAHSLAHSLAYRRFLFCNDWLRMIPKANVIVYVFCLDSNIVIIWFSLSKHCR